MSEKVIKEHFLTDAETLLNRLDKARFFHEKRTMFVCLDHSDTEDHKCYKMTPSDAVAILTRMQILLNAFHRQTKQVLQEIGGEG